MPKKQTNIRLTTEERRALKMLAAARSESVARYVSEMIAEKWTDLFPGKSYPDREGKIASTSRKQKENKQELDHEST